MWLEGLLAVVDDLVVGAAEHFLLRPLASQPLCCALTADVIAQHDAADAHLVRGGDADDGIEVDAAVEARLEEDGAFQPFLSALQEVGGHGGVDDVVDGLGVLG